MSATPPPIATAEPADQPVSLTRDAWRRLKQNRLATFSLVLVGLMRHRLQRSSGLPLHLPHEQHHARQPAAGTRDISDSTRPTTATRPPSTSSTSTATAS
jgi:hypothetical protein